MIKFEEPNNVNTVIHILESWEREAEGRRNKEIQVDVYALRMLINKLKGNDNG